MKNTMYKILGLEKLQVGLYGVEIEVEGNNLPDVFPHTWRIDNDPSLKAGAMAYEYVMKKPGSLEEVKDALGLIKERYKDYNTQVLDSITSGVHVHVNVQELTPRQMFTFMTAYYILEELLLTFCGPQREGNHFCLRAKDAEWVVFEITKSAHSRNFGNLSNEQLRYASLNPCSLSKYGSLELRAMRGTGDLDAIQTWVEIIDRLYHKSLEFANPYDLMVSMSYHGEVEFVKSMLQDKANYFTNHPNLKTMVRNGARIIQPLAFTVEWDKFKDVNNNPFAKAI